MVKPSTSVRQLKKSNHLPSSEQFHSPGWQAKSMESIQYSSGNVTLEEEEGGYNSSSLSRLEAKALSSWQPPKKGLVDRGAPLTRSEGTLIMESSMHETQRHVPGPRSSTNLSDSHGAVSSRHIKGHSSQMPQQSGSCKTISQMKHSSSAWSLSKTLAFCKQRLSKSAERLISTSSHSSYTTKTATNVSSANLDKEERENVQNTQPPPTYHSSVYRLMKKITDKRKSPRSAAESQQDVVRSAETNANLKYDQRTTLSVLASLTSPPPSATLVESVYAQGSQSSHYQPYPKSTQSGSSSHQLQPLKMSHGDNLSQEITADDPRSQLKVQLWLAGGDSSASNNGSPNKRASAYSQRNSGMAVSPTSPTVILRSISQHCYSGVASTLSGEALSSNFGAINSRNSSSTMYGNIPSSTALSLNGSASNPSFNGVLCINDDKTNEQTTKPTRTSCFGLSEKYSPQHPYPPMPSPGVDIQCSPTSVVPMSLTEDPGGIISSSGNSSSLSSLNTSTGAFVPASARLSRDSAICLSQAINSAQVSSQSDSSCMSLLTSCASPQAQTVGNPLEASGWNASTMTTSMIRNNGDDNLLHGQAIPISRVPTRSTFSCMPVAHKQANTKLQTPRPPPPPYFRHSGGSGSPKSSPNGKVDLSPCDLKASGLLNTSFHSPINPISSKDLFYDQHFSQFRHSLLFPDRPDLLPANMSSKESPPASPAAPFVRGNYVPPPAHLGDYSNWRQHLPYKLSEHEVSSQLPRHSTCTGVNQHVPAQHPLRRSLEARNEHKRSSLMEFQMTEPDLLIHSQHQKLPLPKALSKKAHSKHSVHDFNIPSGSNHASRLFPVPSSSSSLSSSSPPSVLDEEKSRQILAEAANLAGLEYNSHFPTQI